MAGLGKYLHFVALSLFVLSTARAANLSNPAVSVPDTAPVTIDGYELFKLRGISARPAEQRTEEIASRIKLLAVDRSISVNSLHLVIADQQTRILAGPFRDIPR